MNRRYLRFLIYVLFFLSSPLSVFADTSISFTPSSPGTWDATSDVTISCGASDPYRWAIFKVTSNSPLEPGATWDGSLCGSTWHSVFGINFQADITTQQDIEFIYIDVSQAGAFTACANGGATISGCLASNAYIAAGSVTPVTYLYTGGGGGGGGSGTTTSATTTSSGCNLSVSDIASSTCVTYYDWLYMNLWQLACLMFIPIGVLFSLLRNYNQLSKNLNL